MRSINRHVSLLFRMGERYVNRKLVGSGVSSGTGILLLELRDGGDRSPSALAAAVGVDKSYVTRALQPLQQAGYVVVTPAPSDRRTVIVALTDRGKDAASLMEKAMLSWIAIFSEGVDPADIDRLEAVFDVFYANAVQYFAANSKQE
ncbi:MAG: MarR family winged helix-turn-helix transcriptional regulator [Caldilineaceae bacterium]